MNVWANIRHLRIIVWMGCSSKGKVREPYCRTEGPTESCFFFFFFFLGSRSAWAYCFTLTFRNNGNSAPKIGGFPFQMVLIPNPNFFSFRLSLCVSLLFYTDFFFPFFFMSFFPILVKVFWKIHNSGVLWSFELKFCRLTHNSVPNNL